MQLKNIGTDKIAKAVISGVKLPEGIEVVMECTRDDDGYMSHGAVCRVTHTGIYVWWDGNSCRGIEKRIVEEALKNVQK